MRLQGFPLGVAEGHRHTGPIVPYSDRLDARLDEVAVVRMDVHRGTVDAAGTAIQVDSQAAIRSAGCRIRGGSDLNPDILRISGPSPAAPVVGPAVVVRVPGGFKIPAHHIDRCSRQGRRLRRAAER